MSAEIRKCHVTDGPREIHRKLVIDAVGEHESSSGKDMAFMIACILIDSVVIIGQKMKHTVNFGLNLKKDFCI